MAKYLVIVESPAKAKTIQKFLGANYTVIASGGHVRDLPKSQLGIDVENGTFEPKYITIRGKGEQLAALRKEVKKADKIYLATDPDREGEAISWHLKYVLKLEDKKYARITFNEITKNAVKSAIANARDIDMDLVNSQQARRVLDRCVGYRISPLLWTKVKRGTSAGRVQSVVLRLIADRENEINSFIQQEYWSIDVSLKSKSSKKPFTANLLSFNDEKVIIQNAEEAKKLVDQLKKAEYLIEDVRISERIKKNPLPFTTSTLQQEASKTLGFSTVKTMSVAQQLYEGVAIKGHGTIGLITYLRTDSVRVSEEAAAACNSFILETYGEQYINKSENKKNSGKKIQDAHEAVRPTYVELTPASVKDNLTREQFRLYQLIWKRFVASQMSPAKYENAGVVIKADGYSFKTNSSKIVFDGYLSVYSESDDTDKASKTLFTPEVNEKLSLEEVIPQQHFTQPAPHYTEAGMVKTMEELGIGRPSTYAPTIATLLARHYITKEKKNLYITEIGEAVNNIMVHSFPSIVDVNFTSNMEALLDGVEDGNVNWKDIISNFYPDLEEAINRAMEEVENVELHDEVTDIVCEQCGRNMVIKFGPHGKFIGCPGFPECKNTKPYYEKTEYICPECNGMLLLRRTRKGRRYFGCENYPECTYMSWQKPDKAGDKKENDNKNLNK